MAVTEASDKVSVKPPSNEDAGKIKLEPNGFNDSMVDVSEQIEYKSDITELSQNVDNVGVNVSGNFYYKNQ